MARPCCSSIAIIKNCFSPPKLSFLSSGLQFVLAPGGNPLSELFIPKDAAIEEYEVCPDAAIVIEEMAKRIAMNGGSSLIVDYGKDGPSGNSLRVRILSIGTYLTFMNCLTSKRSSVY